MPLHQKNIAKRNQIMLCCETGAGPVMRMAQLKPVHA
jgi:hypothetical protein